MTTTFRRLYVSLGRYGDIVNVLPVLRAHAHRTSQKPILMTGVEFRPLLDGCSWLEPMVWRGPWQDCLEALAAARRIHPDVELVNAAVYGIGFKFAPECASFVRDAWRLARSPVPWDRLPVDQVFDQRDPQRERDLVAKFKEKGRPLVLCAFSGVSTPFRAGHELWSLIKKRLPGAKVVDISDVRAERFYDLLGLFEAADCLVCSDSAPLHLAQFMPKLPVISLISDQSCRWQRSEWRPQHFARFYYSEAQVAPAMIVEAVARAVAGDRSEIPKLWHVCSHVGVADVDTIRRMELARESWDDEASYAGNWERLEVKDADLPRDTATVYGEPRPCPFLKDVIDVAARRARPHDIIVLSNSDVGFTPGITGWILDGLIRSDAAWTHRWDSDVPISRVPVGEYEVARLRWYCGSDLWAFRRSWYDLHRDELPDMALGREGVDLVLRQLIKTTGGVEIPAAVWHEKHPSFWEHWGHRETLRGNLENRVLATEFLRSRGIKNWVDGVEVRPGR